MCATTQPWAAEGSPPSRWWTRPSALPRIMPGPTAHRPGGGCVCPRGWRPCWGARPSARCGCWPCCCNIAFFLPFFSSLEGGQTICPPSLFARVAGGGGQTWAPPYECSIGRHFVGPAALSGPRQPGRFGRTRSSAPTGPLRRLRRQLSQRESQGAGHKKAVRQVPDGLLTCSIILRNGRAAAHDSGRDRSPPAGG